MPENILTDSRMAMWRSLIALAYVDGKIADGEKAMLLQYLKANNISAKQYAVLENDMNKGVNINDVYPGIVDVRDRANLLNMGRVLFFRDGDFSAAEQKLYDIIHKDQEKAVDFAKAEAHAEKVAADYNLEMIEQEKARVAKEKPLERLIDRISRIPDFFTGDYD